VTLPLFDLEARAQLDLVDAVRASEIAEREHLSALQLQLSNERVRLANATTAGERELRAVWVAQLEREIAGEHAFLGERIGDDMTDDELLAALQA
jgi:hypothetical protein